MKMSYMCAISLMTAICCAFWAVISVAVGLSSWIGFAGCTTYFAILTTGCKGLPCVKKSIFCNLLGVACAMLAIYLGSFIPILDKFGLTTALISFIMLMLSQHKLFNYSPGIFIGCFSTFAANADLKAIIPALIVGVFLGFICDITGNWFYFKISKK